MLARDLVSTSANTPDDSPTSSYLRRWVQALEACGTPFQFVSDAQCHSEDFIFAGSRYKAVAVRGGGHARRRELMAQQKPYQSINDQVWHGVYRRERKCLLCQNLVHLAELASLPHAPTFVLERLESGTVIPNRYPAFVGHSLYLMNHHDISRAASAARVPTVAEFAEVIQHAREHGLIAMRNHPRDGMSIPMHDHFHLVTEAVLFGVDGSRNPPCDVPLGEAQTFSISRMNGTPFDSLVLEGPSEWVAKAVHSLLRAMELAGEIVTVVSVRGSCIVTPRKAIVSKDQVLSIGCGVGIHFFDPQNEGYMKAVHDHIPRAGEYDWSPYIAEFAPHGLGGDQERERAEIAEGVRVI